MPISGGFAGGFASALNQGLNRKASRDAYRNRSGQPDYSDIDSKYGVGGVGGWGSQISDWLHRNTGGILGHAHGGGGPSDPAGEVQRDAWNEQLDPNSVTTDLDAPVSNIDPAQAVALDVQGGARGGMVRGYKDGGYVTRSYKDGGDVVRDRQRRYLSEGTDMPVPRPYGDVDPNDPDEIRRRENAAIDAERDESFRRATERGPVGGARREAQEAVPPPTVSEPPVPEPPDARPPYVPGAGFTPPAPIRGTGSATAAPSTAVPMSPAATGPSLGEAITGAANVQAPDATRLASAPMLGEDRAAEPGAPTPATPPAADDTSSAAGRWVRRQVFGTPEEQAAQAAINERMKKIAELSKRRTELTDPLEQKTEAKRKADEAEVKKIDTEAAKVVASAPAPAPAPATGAVKPKPTAVPVPSKVAAAPYQPLGVTGGAGPDVIAPVDFRPGQTTPPVTTPVTTPTKPAAPPPVAPSNTGPAQTTVATGTGGQQGAASVATPPPGATPAATTPQTRTKAYDPDTEGPGAIPPGTVVAGSRGVPTAVPMPGTASGSATASNAPTGAPVGRNETERAYLASKGQGKAGQTQEEMLHEAVTGGAHHLHETFDQNSQTAVPGAPNPQKDAGRMALHGGHGAPGPDVVHAIDQGLKAHGLHISKNDKWQAERLVRGYQFYKNRGNKKMADAFAGELLQHHNMMMQHYGQGALEALRQGDTISATNHILDGYNIHMPDGMTARKGPGSTVEFVNPKGAVVQRVNYTPQNLWQAATGMSNGTLFHRELENRYRNSAEYKSQLAQERAEQRERRSEDAARRAEAREERAERRDAARGSGGGGTPTPSHDVFNKGGMVARTTPSVRSFQAGGAVEPGPAQAVSLSPSPTFAPGLVPEGQPAPAPEPAPEPAPVPVEREAAPAPEVARDADPNVVPSDVYHGGELVKDEEITPYEKANPEDTKPLDPVLGYREGWRERLNALGLKTDKVSKASYAAANKEHAERVATYKRDLGDWSKRKTDYEKLTKEERTKIAAERKAQAHEDHGGDPSKDAGKRDEYASSVDTSIKSFTPSETEKGKTPFDQTIELDDGKTKPVVDPLTNRQLVTELAVRNNMPTDQAVQTYQKLTAYDPARPNWRAFDNKGRDAAGNYIIVPLAPKRDDKGKVILGRDGQPMMYRTSEEIHMRPAQHRLLNQTIAARIDARKAELAKPPPKSVWKGLGDMGRALIPDTSPAAPPPQ